MENLKNLLIGCILILSIHLSASAQGIRRISEVLVSGGFPNATVRVCTEPAVGVPCTPLATIYSDPGLTQVASNPLTTDGAGNYAYFANPAATYHEQVSGAGLQEYDIAYIMLPISAAALLAANNTWTGSNSMGNLNGIEVVDGVRNVNIAAAIAHLPAQGGLIQLPSHYRETITTHIDLGNGTTSAVVIEGLGDAILLCEVTDGSYCFKLNNNSGFIGLNPWTLGSSADSLMIRSGPGMNVANMLVPSGIAQASLILEKVSIVEDGTAPAPTNACLLVDGLGNLTILQNVFVECRGAKGIQVSSFNALTGPFTLENVWSLNVSTAGGQPCVIQGGGNSLVGINLNGGTACNDPGAGLAALTIDGNGNSGGVKSIDIASYSEMSCALNNTTGIKINDAYGVLVHGTYVPCGGGGGTGNSGIVISQSGAGRTRGVTVLNTFSQNTAGGCVMSNTITGECGPANNNTQSTISKYEYTADSALEPSVTSGGSDSRWVNQSGSTELVVTQNGVTIPTAAIIQQLGQNNAHVWADNTSCATSTKTITFAAGGYTSTPVILVSDETTAGGARVSAKSNTSFTVTCTGATDNFDWLAVGNPN